MSEIAPQSPNHEQTPHTPDTPKKTNLLRREFNALLLIAIVAMGSSEPQVKRAHCEFGPMQNANFAVIKDELQRNITIQDQETGQYINGCQFLKDTDGDHTAFTGGRYEFGPREKHLMANISNSLNADQNQQFAWSLEDYSRDEIDALYQDVGHKKHREGVTYHYEHKYPEVFYTKNASLPEKFFEQGHLDLYSFTLDIVEGSKNQEEAILRLIAWVSANFVHFYENWRPTNVYNDGKNEPDHRGWYKAADLKQLMEERIESCHEPTDLLVIMARNANIPAAALKVSGHGVVYFPTLDRYVHGDVLAIHELYHPKDYLLTEEEIMSRKDGKEQMMLNFTAERGPIGLTKKREGDQWIIEDFHKQKYEISREDYGVKRRLRKLHGTYTCYPDNEVGDYIARYADFAFTDPRFNFESCKFEIAPRKIEPLEDLTESKK